MVDKVQR